MTILLEQLVYGNFPFWDRGYDVLSWSPGFRPEWRAEVLAACRRFRRGPLRASRPRRRWSRSRSPAAPGRSSGSSRRASTTGAGPARWRSTPCSSTPATSARPAADPFAFAGALGRDWSAGTTLAALPWTVEPPGSSTAIGLAWARSASRFLRERAGMGVVARPPGHEPGPSDLHPTGDAPHPRPLSPGEGGGSKAEEVDLRTRRIVEALSKRRRVAIESAGPIDHLAREVWAALPGSVRDRASVATWAFGNANRFDLVALPRLAGVELDPSYVDLDAGAGPRPPRALPYSGRALSVAALAAVVAGGPGLARPARNPRPRQEPRHPGRSPPCRRSGRRSGRGSSPAWIGWPTGSGSSCRAPQAL